MPAKLEKIQSGPSIQKRNVELLEGLEAAARLQRTGPERFCDTITAAAGEFWFMAMHGVWFGLWIVLNLGFIPFIKPFDPYPFSFLTFVVSLEAIFLSLSILMSQNHEARQADKRAKLDLQINLLDERETTKLLQLVKALCVKQGIDVDSDADLEELSRDTRPEKILRDLEDHDSANQNGAKP